MPAVLKDYKPVTAERLRKPDDQDWLMIRRTYDGWGFSPLSDITPANVQRLKPAWVFSTGEARVHQAAPLVNGGVMFVTSPNNQVIAIDVKSGNLLWRYRRPLETGMNVPHQTNRGVALYGDRVFFAAGEAVLVALDARTGREVWTSVVADNKAGYYTTLAPLVAGGVVMVGASGGEFGIRGFVAGFDVETGKEKWRTYTVPAPGEPGSETWPKGDRWKTGGAPVWVTGNYDPETNLAFWGTGNGGPTIGDQRPGDNLYVTSTIALDVATGAIKGYHQYHPNDSWDWDEGLPPPILVDYQRNGQRTIRKRLIDVARDGYIWVPRAQHRSYQVCRGKALRLSRRLPQPRSSHRKAGCRSRQEADDGKARGLLSRCSWRQELAADRLQPAHADHVHPREQQLVRLESRHDAAVHARAAVRWRERQSSIHQAWRQSCRRSAGVECGHWRESMDARLR